MSIQRHFLGWNRPALPVAAEFLTDRFAKHSGLDLSQVVLVFSGRRAARRMLELLVEQSESRWPAMISPRMTTFDRFPELLYREQRRLADDMTQLLVWRQALLKVGSKALQPAIPNLPPEDSLSSWMALCGSLRRQHDELAAEGLDFENVFDALVEVGIRSESERWKALRKVQAEYLMQMDDLDLWDRQTARLVAVERRECSTDCDIVLIGTVDINGIVCRMLDQVADRVTALIHAPESEEDAFDQYGCLIPKIWQERRIDIPDDVTIVADDPVDQADRLVKRLADDPTPRRPDEIAIGVADDGLIPAVIQTLTNAGVTGRWPIGSEVRDSRPWRLLSALADHLGTAQQGQPPDFASLSSLVRHPDVGSFVERELSGNGLNAVNWLTELDQYRSFHLQPFPGEFLRSREANIEVIRGICTAVERLQQQLLPPNEQRETTGDGMRGRTRKVSSSQQSLPFDGCSPRRNLSTHAQMERRRPLDEWAVGMLQLLAVIYGNEEADRHASRRESLEACFEALKEISDTLAAIPGEVMPRCTAAQALPVILSQIAGQTIAAPDDETAIDLMGWLEIPMDDSPVVVIAGFNEGRIPESATSDVFLPNTVRSQLGLTDNERRYARDAWALQTLLNNREQLTLIAGRHDADGDPLSPSRLWFAGDEFDIPRRVRQFYKPDRDDAQSGDIDMEPAGREPRISGFTVPAPPPGRRPPEEIAVTSFRRYLECPYRYLLERELSLDAIEDHPREMDARAFGNVIHDVLSDFGMCDARTATDPRYVEDRLLDLLDRQIVRRFGKTQSATVAVQLQMIRERLRGFAAWQAAQADEGWMIHDTEKKLTYPDFHDRQGRSVTINGRIDRIDRHQKTGQWRVFDYKTSESDQTPMKVHRDRNGIWKDLQLPLYRLLARTIGVDGDVKLGYVNLPGDVTKVGAQIADWTDDDLESAWESARDIAAGILDLRIDALARQDPSRSDVSLICQDTVVNPQVPWLASESGKRKAKSG